jgi:Mn-dependent DtxR family transcriptional regulator
MNQATSRDKEYLRVIYLLDGYNQPVGPAKLAETLGVSKVCAFQKMHRLQAMGYGDYVTYNGLKINDSALEIIKQDVQKHHIIEEFLQKNTGLSHHDACQEANILSKSISEKLYDQIMQNMAFHKSSCCGYSLVQPLTPDNLAKCPWVQRSIKGGQ